MRHQSSGFGPHHPRAQGGLSAPLLTALSLLGLCLVGLGAAPVGAQSPSAQASPERGLRTVDPRWHALTGATVVTEPGVALEGATIVLRDGLIDAVRADGSVPEGARRWDLTGLTVYAGLIDSHVPVDVPFERQGPAGHWNDLVLPERTVLSGEGADKGLRKELRELGFASAVLAPKNGVFRGSSALVGLGEERDDTQSASAEILARDLYSEIAFQTVGWGSDAYPSSEMGAIALMRQCFSDAAWLAGARQLDEETSTAVEPAQPNAALEALNRFGNSGAPFAINTRSELQIQRAADLARAFELQMIAIGSGMELRRLDSVVAAGLPIILPLDFPEAPKVDSAAKAQSYSLRALMTWEQAPTNPRRLLEAGLKVVLTSDKLEKRKQFWPNLRRAIQHGLSTDDALAMLTTGPAELFGVDDRLGRIRAGALANLTVCDGELFDKKASIRSVWVGGRRYEVNPAKVEHRTGHFELMVPFVSSTPGSLTLSKGNKVTFEIEGLEFEVHSAAVTEDHLSFLVSGKTEPHVGVVAFEGVIEGDSIHGSVRDPGGERHVWSASAKPDAEASDEATSDPEQPNRAEMDAAGAAQAPEETAAQDSSDVEASDEDEGEDEDAEDEAAELERAAAESVPAELVLPLGAYGYSSPPQAENVRIENVTLWTSGPKGIIENATLVVRDGLIQFAGAGSDAPAPTGNERRIDGQGKHVTPGLIDCHSHTGISNGVNEGGQRVTAEVSVGDVISPDDINFYRQLAGGLTAANQLHGSANAIGGQNSVIKLRWGSTHANDMKLVGAPSGIKFALGENPKRVASQSKRSDEYPQTRMGVEALIVDRLSAARDYDAAWRAWEALDSEQRQASRAPRRDYELEALAEVLRGERLVHCHSYRQDEIFMLCRVADEFGFKIGTFQHVLEGYKIAEAIKDSAIGASTFSDWWSYKFEVIDAIPFNAALMTDVGVNVSINSDSSEHARRLNTEAAKSMRYGGLDAAEALKLVTINPAQQLGVGDRIGSLEQGKQADFAIWSASPMSYSSRCESTWIDGAEYYSLERDAAARTRAQAERSRILQKLRSKQGKGSKAKGKPESPADKPGWSDRWDRSEFVQAGQEHDRDGQHRGVCDHGSSDH